MAKRLPRIQILLTSGVRNYFCLNDMSLRICMVPYLSRYFHFWENYLLKLAESLCLRKGGHVTNCCKRPITRLKILNRRNISVNICLKEGKGFQERHNLPSRSYLTKQCWC